MQETIKILLLSTYDVGGAGNAFLKTTEMLRSKGVDATLLVCNKKTHSDAVVGVFNADTVTGSVGMLLYRIYCKIRKFFAFGKADKKYIMSDLQINIISAKRILFLYGKRPDIIRVGWVTDFVSTKTIKILHELTNAKINYVMTDNAPMCGGCHYPWNCQGYMENCYPCPALHATNKRAQKTLFFKKKYITPEMIVSGSTNDMNRAKKSLLFNDTKRVVSVKMNQNPFCFSKEDGRLFFDIPKDRYVILCGSTSCTSPRKGFKELVKSLDRVRHMIDVSRIIVLIVGDECGELPLGYEIKTLGMLSFENVFRAYACADLFLSPSLEDSGPMMLKYGVMAYVPVVAFEMGYAIDMISHKENGYIAKWGDVDDFATGIVYCISHQAQMQTSIKTVTESVAARCNNRPSVWDILGISLS